MPNEFEFSFLKDDMQTLMVDGVTEIVVSGKVLYDQKSQTSTFEISARGVGTPESAPSMSAPSMSAQTMSAQTMSALSIKGCPTPC